jgi:hypothetical protein
MRSLIVIIIILCVINKISAQSFSYKKTTEGIEINENSRPVLFLQTKPKSINGKYERSGYVHPLNDLKGNVITEDMPEDHPYHRGIFWAWHQVVVDGKNVADGWISENIAFVPGKTQVTKSDKNIIVSFQTTWQVKDSSKGEISVINELSRINIFRANEKYRIIDFSILLKPVVKNVMLGGSDDKKGYGGFCLRLKQPENIQFVSGNKNVEPKEEAVMAGQWMDFKLDGGAVAVLGYADSSEQHPWILRNSKSMQNVPYPGRMPAAISAEGLKLDYTIVVHDGSLGEKEINALFTKHSK